MENVARQNASGNEKARAHTIFVPNACVERFFEIVGERGQMESDANQKSPFCHRDYEAYTRKPQTNVKTHKKSLFANVV